MQLNWMDVLVFALFFVIVVGVSVFKSRREKSSEDYFLAGRGLKWWLIGISIVAANISTEQFVGMAGQGAGSVGLAVSTWQLVGTIGIVIIAFTLLPRFLKAGIYTMPEYLEYRFNPASRSLMALITAVIYVTVLVPGVLYSGGLALHKILDMDLVPGILLIGIIAAFYTVWGGLKAIAWADLFQGLGLLVGGLITFYLGIRACGGWEQFSSLNADKLHLILPASNPDLPWTGLLCGMWIVTIYYCGLNQFIVQRNLAAKTLRDGQLGVIFAGALWLLVPFAIVIPGIIANQLYGADMTTPDEAFPTLIKRLIPDGIRGFMFAAIAGAVVSSLASMLNSASTIVTMDVYNRMIDRKASQKKLILMGRVLTVIFVLIGCFIAPSLADPKFKGVFNYIQQFQGYIWPGVVAAFLFGFIVKKAPGSTGVVALIGGPIIYGIMQYFFTDIHFLIQVFITFIILCAVMTGITIIAPLKEPRNLPVRKEMDVKTEPIVKIIGALVLIAVVIMFIIFW
ncbi:MAG: solute:sodium symporter family transporter [Lentisphaerae bacterium]|nr:solute:sodium symporter family transporter [Lentisphaerota bacterium]MCP4101340.1 solute:sodium symporter family transporter [Lentisphaerota bacterium]